MLYYKTMGTDQIMYCIIALILGMLLANMLKNVCGCKNVIEGGHPCSDPPIHVRSGPVKFPPMAVDMQ